MIELEVGFNPGLSKLRLQSSCFIHYAMTPVKFKVCHVPKTFKCIPKTAHKETFCYDYEKSIVLTVKTIACALELI